MEKKILIVDDDTRNIYALKAVLRSRGFDCLTATGMDEAFKHLDNGAQVQLLLLDMMMPDMDGYEALSRLRARDEYRKLPVVAVTAQAMAGDKEKCLAAGADDYISKPVNVDHLEKILQKYML